MDKVAADVWHNVVPENTTVFDLSLLLNKMIELGLSDNLNYYLFNSNVDLRKGIFRLCGSIREEMLLTPSVQCLHIHIRKGKMINERAYTSYFAASVVWLMGKRKNFANK